MRGAGVMLGFDVMRADWCDALLDRAFRRGLVLLPAGERTVRFYPRYDTEPSAIDEALSILRLAIEDLVGGRVATDPASAVKIRVGTLAIPLDTVETVDLTPATFETCKLQILAVEQERYRRRGAVSARCVRAPDTTAAAVSARDARSDRGQPPRDRHRLARPRLGAVRRLRARQRAREPRRGRASARIHASARTTRSTCRRWPRLPTVQNDVELENCLLDSLRMRAIAAGFEFLSTLIEDRLRDTAPAWFRSAAVLERIENYLHSGARFAYLQVALKPGAETDPGLPAGG